MVPAAFGQITAPLDGSSSSELTVKLPGLRAGTRLLAIDLLIGGAQEPVSYSVQLTLQATIVAAVGSTGGATPGQQLVPIKLVDWAVQPVAGAQGSAPPFSATNPGAAVSLAFSGRQESTDPQPTTVRLMPAAAADARVPVVVNASLAQSLGLRAGDQITLSLPGVPLPIQIAGISERIPGFTEPAVMVADLPLLQIALLRVTPVEPATNEIWLATGDPGEVTRGAAELAGPAAAVSAVGSESVEALLRPAVRGLWWGTGGALLLAVIGLLLMMATLARSRRSELVVLRALGVPSALQARMRRWELYATAIPAWILGLAAGFGTAALIVPGLARQAVVAGSSGQNPPLLLGWSTWGFLLAVHVVLMLVAIGWQSVSVRRHAHAIDAREVAT